MRFALRSRRRYCPHYGVRPNRSTAIFRLEMCERRTQQIEAAMLQERVFVTLTSGFGLLALGLASVGIYGIMAYSVAQRSR